MPSHNKRANRPYATRILHTLLFALLTLVVLHLTLQFLNLNIYYQQNGQVYELSNRFDFDDEASLPTWFSQLTLLFVGASAALAAYLQPKPPVRRMWRVIAVVGVVMSIDEVATLHERLLQALHVLFFKDAASGGLTNAWLLVIPLVLIAGGTMIWAGIRHLPKRTLMLFVLSGIFFLLGAIGIDLLTSIVERENFLSQGILVAAEESLELLGVILAIYAIADYIERQHYSSIEGALRQLRPSERYKDEV